MDKASIIIMQNVFVCHLHHLNNRYVHIYTCVYTHSHVHTVILSSSRLNETINQMDEREHSSDTTIASLEKELSLRQQVMEMHKKKALESVQSLQETRLKFSDVEGQVEEARKAMQSKADECERETQQLRR